MTKAEYMRLRNTAWNQNKKQLSMVIETLAVTGARVSELQFFTVERIEKGRIEVFNKGKRRVLLLAIGLRKKLLYFAIKSGIKKGCIFVTPTGRPKDRSNLWREMKELSVESGVDGEKRSNIVLRSIIDMAKKLGISSFVVLCQKNRHTFW